MKNLGIYDLELTIGKSVTLKFKSNDELNYCDKLCLMNDPQELVGAYPFPLYFEIKSISYKQMNRFIEVEAEQIGRRSNFLNRKSIQYNTIINGLTTIELVTDSAIICKLDNESVNL